jgi:hypothetical protein
MTPEELAARVNENRNTLRRDAQWTCYCSNRTKPIAVVYLDGDGQAFLWTAGRQGLAQDGTVTKPRARAVNLTERVMSGADLLEFAQCRRCRRSLVFTLHEGDLRMVAQLDSPTRAVVAD